MTEENRAGPAEKETGRLEAFSDGVFAVAITLLVLDLIKVPQAPEGQTFTAADLAAILGRQWPTYATFLISFATILILWMNHHSMFQWVQKNDPVFMFANGFLLLLITLVPFPTALLGDYLLEPAAPTAATMYAGLFVIISLAFMLRWWTAGYRRPLLRPGIPPARIRQRTAANLLGFPAYVLALACAFWSPLLTVAICAALWIFWAIIGMRL
jgi:uncharacterized membrane protein